MKKGKIVWKCLAAIVLVGSVLGVFTANAASAPLPKPSGELRIALSMMGSEVLDPVLSSGAGQTYMDALYDPLVGVNADGRFDFQWGLATKIDTSSDGTSHVFHLRRGVKFHNGDELTAEDVKLSLKRITSKRAISTNAPSLRRLIENVEAVDRYTVRIRTKPYGWIKSDLSRHGTTEGYIVPARYISEKGEDYFSTHPVGTGPYRFVKHVAGSYMEFEANPNYWRGVPRWKTIRFLLVPEETTRTSMLQRGEVDLIDVSIAAATELKKQGFPIHSKEKAVTIRLRMNQTWDPKNPLSNKNFREALCISINRDELAQHIFGGMAMPSASQDPSIALDYEPQPPYPYDPIRARKLVQEAGYAGYELKFYSYPRLGLPEYAVLAQALAGYWTAVGLKVKVITTEYAAYRKLVSTKKIGPGALAVHPASYRFQDHPSVQSAYHSKGNTTGAKIPELDAMIESLFAALDDKSYQERGKQVYRYLRGNNLGSGLLEVSEVFASGKNLSTWKTSQRAQDVLGENLLY